MTTITSAVASPYISRFGVSAIVATLLLLLYLFLEHGITHDETLTHWWIDLAWTMFSMLAAWRAWRVSVQLDGRLRRTWQLVALGCGLWFVGMLIWDYNELVLGEITPFPALSDVGYILLAPCFFFVFVLLRPEPRIFSYTLLQITTIGIMATALIILNMVFLASPLESEEHELVYKAVALAYPVVYMAIFVYGFVSLLGRRSGTQVIVEWLLLTGFACHVAADTIYAYAVLGYTYQAGNYLDAMWLIGFVFIYLAAEYQASRRGKGELPLLVPRVRQFLRYESLSIGITLLGMLVMLYAYRDVIQGALVNWLTGLGVVLVFFITAREWLSRSVEAGLLGLASQAEERFRATFEQAAVGIAHIGMDGKWLRVNQALCDIVGYEREKLLSMYVNDITHPKDIDKDRTQLNQLANGDIHTYFIEKRYLHKNHSIVWVASTVTLVRDVNNAPDYFIAVIENISKRKQIEHELALYQEHLEELVEGRTVELMAALKNAEVASQAKTEFLSNMSHELRTPMNAVLGFAQILELEPGKISNEQLEFIREILNAGNHLLQLIDEILDLSRIESGRLEINLEPICISKVIDECLAVANLQSRAQNVHIEVNASAACNDSVLADHVRLKEILFNLISNAVKYNRPDGSVKISCERRDTSLAIMIRDTGYGIERDKMPELFEPFSRLGAQHSAIPGTGIGLTIVKRLVELMQGEIEVSSEPGKGSCFTVLLPLSNQE